MMILQKTVIEHSNSQTQDDCSNVEEKLQGIVLAISVLRCCPITAGLLRIYPKEVYLGIICST